MKKLVLLVGVLLSWPLVVPAQTPADAELITQRLREKLLREAPAPSPAAWLRTQRPDGSWPDIDYADRSHADWKPLQHLLRMRALAVAASAPNQAPGGEPVASLQASYGRALDYWLRHDPEIYSGNWWYGRLGEQIQLGEALLLMRPALSTGQVRAGSALLEANEGGCGLSDQCTGQNLVWASTAAIYKGCLENNPAYLQLGFQAIQSTVVVTTADEGIQPDLSFRQHRAQLYAGGYGMGFVRDVSGWISVSQGTAYAFSAPAVELFSRLVLDADQWMVRGEVFDYSTQGREISRQGVSNKALQLAAACDRMAALRTARQREFEALAAHIRGTGPPPLRGNRHFWRADYMTHQQATFASSVRLWSTRTAGLENFNRENSKGSYLPQGTHFLYRRGDEYRDIFPVWDWSRLPGVTCPYGPTPPLPAPGQYRYGSTAFVGGVSDGRCGLAAFDCRQDSLTARKSWFFFDEGIFCLGAGITSSSHQPVYTSVNQCLQAGLFQINSGGAAQPITLPAGPQPTVDHQAPATEASWAYHDSVAYLFPAQPGRVTLRNAAQTGSWKSINDQYSADLVTRNVVSLWLDHGRQPRNASYEYTVLPGVTVAQATAYAAQPPVRVLRNTPGLQAVHYQAQHLSALAFYEAGQLSVPAGFTVSVDKPCLLLVHRQGRRLTLTAANPFNTALDLTVEMSTLLRGPGAERVVKAKRTRLRLTLPSGPEAGKSLSQQYQL